MHFHEWKVLHFDSNFTEVCSQRSNEQYIPALVQIMAWRRSGDKPFQYRRPLTQQRYEVLRQTSTILGQGGIVWNQLNVLRLFGIPEGKLVTWICNCFTLKIPPVDYVVTQLPLQPICILTTNTEFETGRSESNDGLIFDICTLQTNY